MPDSTSWVDLYLIHAFYFDCASASCLCVAHPTMRNFRRHAVSCLVFVKFTPPIWPSSHTLRALADLCNQVSLAVAARTALRTAASREVDERLFFNTDATSILLEDGEQAIHATAEARQALKKHARAPGHAAKEAQAHTISFLPAINSAGECVVALFMFKESGLGQPRLTLVCPSLNIVSYLV